MSYRWFDDTENAHPPEHYGWIVEVDPFDPESKPRKHTWLGRLRHENAAVTLSESGKVVVYTGHDQEDQRIYKFVSSGAFDPNDREANFDLLTDGMLYVANFAEGRWVPLDYGTTPSLATTVSPARPTSSCAPPRPPPFPWKRARRTPLVRRSTAART
jgi:secreted PhoX family phosphatase